MKKDTSHKLLFTRDVSIGYNQKALAKNVNLSIDSGQLVAVVGVNGSGKSTLLKTLTGNLAAISGTIFLQQKAINDYSPVQLSEQISIVHTQAHFSKNLRVKELVALGRHPYTNWLGMLSSNDKKAVRNALQLIDIEDKAERKCNELSDGQLQKVLLARALAQDTQLIILDEPTTHLDLYHKVFVFRLLKELSEKTQKAIIFATHEINLALQLCDQIILVNQEKVIQESPENLIKKGCLKNLFPSDLIQFDASTKNFKIVR